MVTEMSDWQLTDVSQKPRSAAATSESPSLSTCEGNSHKARELMAGNLWNLLLHGCWAKRRRALLGRRLVSRLVGTRAAARDRWKTR
jgi:hypothetical protein